MNRLRANENGAQVVMLWWLRKSLSPRCVIELLMLVWGTPQGLVTPARV